MTLNGPEHVQGASNNSAPNTVGGRRTHRVDQQQPVRDAHDGLRVVVPRHVRLRALNLAHLLHHDVEDVLIRAAVPQLQVVQRREGEADLGAAKAAHVAHQAIQQPVEQVEWHLRDVLEPHALQEDAAKGREIIEEDVLLAEGQAGDALGQRGKDVIDIVGNEGLGVAVE